MFGSTFYFRGRKKAVSKDHPGDFANPSVQAGRALTRGLIFKPDDTLVASVA
ncbi:hypothetical protein H8A95_37215 [Bradyrhizobium sp. Pear76]|uniref:hypothetical protein n=1 Tax=Bradyrhizobium oropedii TaxID=1571201 RepID=UPI001E4AFD84|nr:hypothetical protein [Bradyrhizobium oropedii]MCC8967802.1 hypothetical protein [Bradyrhizobium oropedii]